MIPSFEDNGLLPSGIHPATLAEIDLRFGIKSELRRVQMESVRWMIDLSVRAGVLRIILNRCFVSDTMEPNDVDCLFLIAAGFPKDRRAEKELVDGLPFLDIRLVDQSEFDDFVNRFYAFDRFHVRKGVVEVIV